MTDDEQAPSPEETLRLIEEQHAATVRRLKGDPLTQYLPWGVAWLLGFTALFLHYGPDGRPLAPITQMQAVGVLMLAQVVAGAVVAYGITKASALVRGQSTARGAMYGYAWFAGMALMILIAIRLSPLLPPDESGLLWASVSLLVVGVLYMAGGAIWLDWPTFFVGTWVVAVDGLGVLLGPAWHALLVAVLLGGGFIAVSLWLRWRG
ncbi:hypothetical protein ABT294_44530 [Nonomuraea sp. NPDC000554]|uniref:hypothetical protein n=1 Tax=Nonomuraea sp. NPDC000554 TaxID=3154259 RepID=UPI003331A5ED